MTLMCSRLPFFAIMFVAVALASTKASGKLCCWTSLRIRVSASFSLLLSLNPKVSVLRYHHIPRILSELCSGVPSTAFCWDEPALRSKAEVNAGELDSQLCSWKPPSLWIYSTSFARAIASCSSSVLASMSST
uniref:Putative secreted protein n=1 Tax=Anopheles darlingi TaxID=43151 RepID=A0A2M4D7R7_ANODA